VTLPWRPEEEGLTGIPGDELELRDPRGNSLPVQFDRISPDDPSRDVVTLALQSELPPGDEHYQSNSVVIRVARGPRREATSRALAPGVGHLDMSSERLKVSFCLASAQPGSTRSWFAGSVDSVTLDGVEMLDIFRSHYRGCIGHDPEKRCMQIDRIRLGSPAWLSAPYQDAYLHRQDYRVESWCVGPVRSSLAMVSKPWRYDYVDVPTNQPAALSCELCRVFTLERGATHVIEEAFVRAKQLGIGSRLVFSARYFTNMDMGHDPELYRFERVPDWFAVGYPHGFPQADHPGYGFATNAHVRELRHPHPDYPDREEAERTYSWELEPSARIRCLHLFMRGNPGGFDARTGHAWYEYVFKDLMARLSEGD
jgi:hypothetical protein